jgi:ATP-dependent DNA helicase UvrD/PcrA
VFRHGRSTLRPRLRYFAGESREFLASKVQLLLPIVRGLPKPFNDRAASDIATEIEWAKNGRVDPGAYAVVVSTNGRRRPLPAELMADVYREYKRRKTRANQIDHEDQLELTIRMFEAEESKLAEFRERYRSFTVDEYQDVNLLQQMLLSLWLGERDDLCVVGDDYQSIYAFTGATPAFLLDVPKRYPNVTVVRLEENYRSTPEILALPNRLAPSLGGAPKTLRPTRPSEPKPVIHSQATNEDEAAFIATRVGALRRDSVPLREIAVLYRVNFRSPTRRASTCAAYQPPRLPRRRLCSRLRRKHLRLRAHEARPVRLRR